MRARWEYCVVWKAMTVWGIGALLTLIFSGIAGALIFAIIALPLAIFLGRQASRQDQFASAGDNLEGFARINKFDEERSIGQSEYFNMVADLRKFIDEAKNIIVGSRSGQTFSFEKMRNLADDLRWTCDEVDKQRLTFRRTPDRQAYRDMMISGLFCSAILHGAAEERRSPAEFDTRVFALKGRFQMEYENAHGDAAQWEISALGLSDIGDNRYLWLYSDKVKGVRYFRVDRILSITDPKTGDKAEGADVADWLAARVQKPK